MIGDRVVIGGATGVADHVQIGDLTPLPWECPASRAIFCRVRWWAAFRQCRRDRLIEHYFLHRPHQKFYEEKLATCVLIGRMDVLEKKSKND